MYYSTDYVPTDSDLFSVCADMLDIYMDFSSIYGHEAHTLSENGEKEQEPYEVVIRLSDKKALFLQQVTE